MKLERFIDHTLLKPDATAEDIKTICHEALEYNFYSVCVNPANVKQSYELLKSSDTKVCTVIGFPLGASTTAVKQFETKDAIKNGATEVDMVINIGALKSQDFDLVKSDIEGVVEAAKKSALVKVIIESALLTNDEIIKACELSKEAGADFVKTSTGFNGGGATVEAVKLMRNTVGEDLGVKASGGISSKKDAELMIENGATRLGASSSVKIIQGEKSNSNY